MNGTDTGRRLAGRVAVVTGAGRGIGRLIALRFAEEGASVVLISRSEAPLRATEAELHELDVPVLAMCADVSDQAQVDASFQRATDELGPPLVVVNNAQSWGRPDSPPLDPEFTAVQELSDEEWDHTLRTGLYGTLHCMRAAYPAMRAASWGRIINIYSPVAAQARPGFAAYTCTKAAILALSRTAAREWGKDGITVNCLSPLVVDDGQRNRLDAIKDRDRRARAKEHYKSKLAVNDAGEPRRDVAAAAAYLAAEEAGYVTGAVLPADGGSSI